MLPASVPNPGQIARVRQRQYLVEEIVPPPNPDDSTLVRLSCVDDDAQGQPLEVLWEQEIDPEVLTGEAWEAIAKRGFDPPKLFSAYLQHAPLELRHRHRPAAVPVALPRRHRLDAYQLEPLRKALLLPRVNLFIADDVGLGKTIEAGLIARELLLRKKVREIVVSLPAVDAAAVAGRAGDPLRPDLRDSRQGLHEAGPPRARLRRQSLEHALALPDLPPAADRRGVRRPAARLARRLPPRLAADPRRSPPRRPGQRPEVRHRLADHPGRPRPGPPLRASAVPLGHAAQRPLEQLLGAARDPRPAAVLPRRPGQRRSCSTTSWSAGSRTTSGRSRAASRSGTSSRSTSTGLPPDAPELRLSALLDEYRELREERLKRRDQTQAGRRRAC